jgi:glycogen operon protein
MLLAGDETGHTQHGNNNAYCQDGPDYWLDWSPERSDPDLHRFVRCVLAFRRAHPVLRRSRHPDGRDHGELLPNVSWHGVRAWTPDWSEHSKLLAAMLYATDGGRSDCVYVAANSYWEPLELELPEPPRRTSWRLFADTDAAVPDEVAEPGTEPRLTDQSRIRIGPRAVLVLTAVPDPGQE